MAWLARSRISTSLSLVCGWQIQGTTNTWIQGTTNTWIQGTVICVVRAAFNFINNAPFTFQQVNPLNRHFTYVCMILHTH